MSNDAITMGFATGPAIGVEGRPTQDDANARFALMMEMAHCNAIEGNPHSEEELAWIETVRRDRWTNAEIDAHTQAALLSLSGPHA